MNIFHQLQARLSSSRRNHPLAADPGQWWTDYREAAAIACYLETTAGRGERKGKRWGDAHEARADA